jgi:hypothetical protein
VFTGKKSFHVSSTGDATTVMLIGPPANLEGHTRGHSNPRKTFI